jgi:hypothetical protein
MPHYSKVSQACSKCLEIQREREREREREKERERERERGLDFLYSAAVK